jgi:hypothetical protein
MADGEDSAIRADRKRHTKHRRQLPVERCTGVEPEARLPDLTNRHVKIKKMSDGSDGIFISIELEKEIVIVVPTEKWLSTFNINSEVMSNLAERFSMRARPRMK